MTTSPLDLVCSRLHKVRMRGPGMFTALCPAHEDRTPSLSGKELPDGRLLMKCQAGCSIHEVVGALGLTLADLFPPREPAPGAGSSPERRRRLLTAGQALELLDAEALLVASAAATLAAGQSLTDDDRDRLLTASARVAVLRDEGRA
jgi:hypothetical protein